ncbi:MAG: 3-methyl-2-oxobutanoate hydroxymethyltransferase [Capsulimonadaceae bacterium]
MSSESRTRMTVPRLVARKAASEKIVVLTAYDYPMGLLVDQAGVDIALVGDSLGPEELGYENTIPVNMEVMIHHCSAVRRGVHYALLVADMPFMASQINSEEALRNAGRLVQLGGANAVKIEGGAAFAPTIRRIVDAGIPVMGHVGFKPQSVNLTGVARQGKDDEGAARVLADARALEAAGAFAVVLELVPDDVAARITQSVGIPTIGIGAGPHCDGQVLVTSDMIGLRTGARALKHVRQYAHVGDEISRAVRAFRDDVLGGRFPE